MSNTCWFIRILLSICGLILSQVLKGKIEIEPDFEFLGNQGRGELTNVSPNSFPQPGPYLFTLSLYREYLVEFHSIHSQKKGRYVPPYRNKYGTVNQLTATKP
jgi:hypothetical protein